MSTRTARLGGAAAVVLLFALQMFFFSTRQPRIALGDGRGDDGLTYGLVADQIVEHRPIRGDAPFVYRLGESWLAAKYSVVFDMDVDDAFMETNLILTGALLLVIYALALDHCSPPFAVAATALYALPFWSYARGVWFYPVLNDLPWMLSTFAGLHLLSRWPAQGPPGAPRVAAFAALCALGCLSRETGIALPIVFALSRPWVRRRASIEALIGDGVEGAPPDRAQIARDVVLGALFAGVAAGALAWTRHVATATGPYRFAAAALESIRHNALWHLALSAALAFGGPLIALFVVYHRRLRAHLRGHGWVAPFVGCVVALSYVGGVNTLRFLSWASPVVLILLAHLAERLIREPLPRVGAIVARALLVAATALYLGMIHPFDGWFADYAAWTQWGGLQFTRLDAAEVLLPCGALALAFVLLARVWIPDARGTEVAPEKAEPAPAE